MKDQVEKILSDIRPALERDGGNIELVDVDEASGIVRVRLQGACVGCPMADWTLKMGIEAALQEAIPAVKGVIAVSE